MINDAFKETTLNKFEKNLTNNEMDKEWQQIKQFESKIQFWSHCYCVYEYIENDRKVACGKPIPYPKILVEIENAVLHAFKLSFPDIFKKIESNKPNCCFGSFCQNKSEKESKIKLYSDDDLFFFETKNKPTLMYCFCLGKSTTFTSKPKDEMKQYCTPGLFNDIPLKNGTIIVMIGWNQKYYDCWIKNVNGHLNLISKTISQHEKQCRRKY